MLLEKGALLCIGGGGSSTKSYGGARDILNESGQCVERRGMNEVPKDKKVCLWVLCLQPAYDQVKDITDTENLHRKSAGAFVGL